MKNNMASSSKDFILSAIAVGLLLLDDNNPLEQNVLGNWLFLVAQILCTNAYYVEYTEHKKYLQNCSKNEIAALLKKLSKALDAEINDI